MKKKIFMMGVAAIIAFSSCGQKEVTDVKTLSGEWVVVELNGAKIASSEDGPYLNLDFTEDRLSGKSGCNNMFGQIELSDSLASSIRFPQVATTMMACPDMEIETSFLKALDQVRSVEKMKDGKVAFLNESGQTLFVVENK